MLVASFGRLSRKPQYIVQWKGAEIATEPTGQWKGHKHTTTRTVRNAQITCVTQVWREGDYVDEGFCRLCFSCISLCVVVELDLCDQHWLVLHPFDSRRRSEPC